MIFLFIHLNQAMSISRFVSIFYMRFTFDSYIDIVTFALIKRIRGFTYFDTLFPLYLMFDLNLQFMIHAIHIRYTVYHCF